VKCSLCEREVIDSKSRYCRHHQAAFQNLSAGFEKWTCAYGKMSWTEYLHRVRNRPEMGVWVKECCEYILKQEDADRG
jgi:hypothetical protein